MPPVTTGDYSRRHKRTKTYRLWKTAMKPDTKTLKTILIPAALIAAALIWNGHPQHVGAQALTRFTGATSSQPLALSADDSLLLVANPDNNSVSLFDLKNAGARLAEIP